MDDEQGGYRALAERVEAAEIDPVRLRRGDRVAGHVLRIARVGAVHARASVGVEFEAVGKPVPAADGAGDVDRVGGGAEAADLPIIIAHASGGEQPIDAEQHLFVIRRAKILAMGAVGEVDQKHQRPDIAFELLLRPVDQRAP